MIIRESKNTKILGNGKNISQKIPLISIGMPVYNGEDFIEEAIESILTQTFDDYELIISDNASKDKTKKICEYYVQKDSRIRYYRNNKNRGAGWNYNYVYKLSKGKYFKWASHDDVCGRTFLEKCVKVLKHNKSIALCYPRTLIINENSEIIKKDSKRLNLRSDKAHKRFKIYLARSGGECNAVFGLIRSSALRKTSLIRNYKGSDFILLGHLALLGKFYEIPEELFFRRDHPGTSIRANINPSMVTQWFDTKKIDKIVFPNWRWLLEYFLCIHKTELSMPEKVLSMIKLYGWTIMRRKPLWRELWEGSKQYHDRLKNID